MTQVLNKYVDSKKVSNEDPPILLKRRIEKIERIIEIKEGLLIGVYENSPNAEVLGFVNPADPRFDARFKRSYLGKVLKYGTFAKREEEERNHKVRNKTFLVIALKKPMELAQGKKEPDMGILVACGYNEFHDKAFLRIVGFFDPMFTKGCYQKIRDHNLKKDGSDEANWPAVDDYWMKLGLGKEYVGTVLTKDSGSLRVSGKNGLVKEIFIQKIFDQ